jgi:hypothetical protein
MKMLAIFSKRDHVNLERFYGKDDVSLQQESSWDHSFIEETLERLMVKMRASQSSARERSVHMGIKLFH